MVKGDKIMIKPEYVIKLLSDNIRRTHNPIGIKKSYINDWWKGLKVKKRGEWLLFTGMLYQLIPYIDMIVNFLEKIEDSRLQDFISLFNLFPKYFLRMFVNKNLKNYVNNVIRSIYEILEGVDVYYDAELDDYSGIILYDFGFEEEFREYAKEVSEKLESAGVQKIVTIDPHTTFALRKLYPKKFEVKTYFEILSEKEIKGMANESVVIHDPCYYGRYLEISDKYRKILEDLGVKYSDISNSGKLTSCCGSFIEAISPKISKEIAKLRLEELGSGKIVTLCPICLENLKRAGAYVEDFALILRKYLPPRKRYEDANKAQSCEYRK